MNSVDLPSTTSASTSTHGLVVPRQDQSVLIAPARKDLPSLVDANTQYLANAHLRFDGVSLQQVREQARTVIFEEAVRYTSSISGEDVSFAVQSPLIVTGHQPELFHAGVWAKNFATAGLAQQCQGLGLNLIIDNDTLANTRLRVPVAGEPATVDSIPFDAAQPEQPWEEAVIQDAACFEAFGDRVRAHMLQNWNIDPLIASSWPAAVRQSRTSNRLSDSLVAARVAAERSHGLRNLEVPMSRVCSTRPFGLFAAIVLRDLSRFHAIYNEAVRDYRRLHHLRSTTHPVPELTSNDGWLEVPFWVWREGAKRRERPVAQKVGDEVQLRDSTGVFARLPQSGANPLEMSAGLISELGSRGIKFRSRALTTTLFARLFLADLFIHGIGGAKYDAMTDQICSRFFGVQAPPFATVTATAYLPLGTAFPASEGDLRGIQQRLRDTRYNPDRFVTSCTCSAIHELLHAKSRIIGCLNARRPTKLEHGKLAELNRQIGADLSGVRARLESEREQIRFQLRVNSVLRDREFAWGLHPEASLIEFFDREFAAAAFS